MKKKKDTQPTSMTGEQRYRFFIESVSGQRQIWALKENDEWILFGDHTSDYIFPVWPSQSEAEKYAAAIRSQCVAEMIPLDRFFSSMSILFRERGYSCMVFPTAEAKGSIVSVDQIRKDCDRAGR